MNLRKKIDEYLLIRKKAKRLRTLEQMSEVTQENKFTISIGKLYMFIDTTTDDLVVAQSIIDNLLEEFTTDFKAMYGEYISNEINKVYEQ